VPMGGWARGGQARTVVGPAWRRLAACGPLLLALVTAACAGAALPTDPPVAASPVATTSDTAATPAAIPATPAPAATPVPQLTPLALPAQHPMATAWVLGPLPGVIERPTRLAVTDAGEIFVLDSMLHKVARFDRTGQLVAAWGSQGFGTGQFTFQIEGGPRAAALAASPDGRVYVGDATNRVQVFDRQGQVLAVRAIGGPGDSEVGRLGGLAIDRGGNLYVTDTDFHRVRKYDPGGKFLVAWGGQGSDDGKFQAPAGIAVDGQGHVYVADGLARIQKFDAGGRFLVAWGVRGDGAGEFRSIPTLAVNGQGIVLATDSGNYRVQAFDRDGNYLTQWGGLGAGIGELNRPISIAVDAHGEIYVLESGNRQVQKFMPRIAWPTAAKGTPTPRPPTPTASPTSVPLPVGPPPFMTPADR
jgi:sugar lactone lactonase YvrE